ncbi:DUF1707 SHOCT-like domain-containing protein [Planosporangium flavigriseum]|uniref:DUF1707 SHOCT-like domain-containing protein n=1 Tax=Planosporangium flavigriseum TaxID=373681 RepID=UPI0019522726|nr:DUF1707 domain-containing protein [Planosporangium flavigriseum]
MTSEPIPRNRELRLSDADREGVVGWLNTALAEGRLTLVECAERVDAVLRARAYSEVEPHLADLQVLAGNALLILSDGATADIDDVLKAAT